MFDLLNDKVAIVTGGAMGLGEAMVRAFVAHNARVIIADIAEERGRALAAELGDSTCFVRTDVMDEGSVQAVVAEAATRFGRLDVMVNNAGSTGDPASALEISRDAIDHTLALDTRSVILGTKHAARAMRDQGTGGSIIQTVSVAGLQGGWSSLSYTTAKHALVGAIRHSAMELSPYRIRVNGIAPGVILTPLVAKSFGVPPERSDALIDYLATHLGPRQAMGRYGSAEDIAGTALYLASDLSAYVSGTVIPVDGGISSYTLSTSDADIMRAAKDFLKQGAAA